MAERNYTPHQQKIIKRYYDNFDAIKSQRLSELAADLYLAAGTKKADRLWKQVEELLAKLEFPPARLEHLMKSKDPSLIVGIVRELEGKGE